MKQQSNSPRSKRLRKAARKQLRAWPETRSFYAGRSYIWVNALFYAGRESADARANCSQLYFLP